MARVAMLLTNPFVRDARVEREARTLTEAGHEVRVFCLAGEGLPTEEERDGYAVRRIPAPRWIAWTGPRRMVPLLRWYSRYEFLARAAAVWRPEVVHGHDLETLLPAARLAGRLGVPHIHDDHELGLAKLGQGESPGGGPVRRWLSRALITSLRRKGSRLERTWIPQTGGLITVNSLCAKVLEDRYGVRPVVLRNTPRRSTHPADPRLRERARLPPDTRIVLYQGMVTPDGGGQESIAAASDFPEGWALVFLGVSWMRPALESQARRAGVEHRVRFLDLVPPSELPGFTRAADIGLAPMKPVNLGQEYSLANKVFEYMHAGLPMVVSDLPLQAELVRDLDAGVVLPGVTPAAIAEAVRTIAAIPETERRHRSARVRMVAEEKHCWEVDQGMLLELYRRVLRTG